MQWKLGKLCAVNSSKEHVPMPDWRAMTGSIITLSLMHRGDRNMTVKELIATLQSLPQEAEALVMDDSGYPYDIAQVFLHKGPTEYFDDYYELKGKVIISG
jgi:hypothetical protein